MATRTIDELERAQRDKLLATFTQPGLDGSDWGYVLDIGPRFFLLAHLDVDGGVRFNGFICFRLADVRELQVPGKQAAFAEAVLKKRGDRLPEKPPVSLTNMEELLLTVHRAAPLVAIYREKKDPGLCKIGGVLDVRNGRLSLLEIDTDALGGSAHGVPSLRDHAG